MGTRGICCDSRLLPLILNAGAGESHWSRRSAIWRFSACCISSSAAASISVVSWAARRLFSQLAASLSLIARAIPLLMIFSVVLFLTTETWQVFADMNDATLAATTLLFVALGTLFLVVRVPREVAELEEDVGTEPPLDRQQRVNVGLILFVSQALQVLFIAVAVGCVLRRVRLTRDRQSGRDDLDRSCSELSVRRRDSRRAHLAK